MAVSDPVPLPLDDQRRDVMKAPEDASAMLRLKALGWGSKRIAAELGCARNTVRRWLTEGDWRACASPCRSKKLDGLSDWIVERFRRHGGNADVVRQELASEKGIAVSLRTVERATAPLRRELVAAARATMPSADSQSSRSSRSDCCRYERHGRPSEIKQQRGRPEESEESEESGRRLRWSPAHSPVCVSATKVSSLLSLRTNGSTFAD